jgi:hypothetical protein
MNSIMVIHPYKSDGMWVFDDRQTGLIQEPFVSGADKIIDRMVTQIPDAESGFTLIFAGTPFPGYGLKLDWRREEYGGNWYYSAELDREGWLCPALFKYFEMTPQVIYAQFKVKE